MSTSKAYSEAELLAYFDRICSCDIDAEALAELQMVLRTQPDAPAMFLQYMSMHADMYGAVRLSRVRKILESEVQLRVDATSAFRTHAKRWGTRLVPILAIAAAVLLLLWPTGSPQGEPMLKWPDAVATLNRVEDVVWSETASQYDVTSILTSGNSLHFHSGLVELELRQGAVVVLEGPAHLVVDDVNRATLIDGKLAAVVPPWAKGFRVNTSSIDVVDHGTRFSMSVSSAAVGDPEVKVLVAEGEVELLKADKPDQNRRLVAGEGVRVNHGALTQHNRDDAATRLVAELPGDDGQRDAVIVGDRWHDWQPGEAGQPHRGDAWRYYTNVGGPFGDPSSYEEFVWIAEQSGGFFGPPGARRKLSHESLGFVKVHRDGGHPGHGKSQAADGLDHYSITSFVVPTHGSYRIEAGWLERPEPKRWDLDHVLDIAVHVNDEPVITRDFCNRSCFLRFAWPLGTLEAGDAIYVGVGPSGVDYSDRFRWGFYVVREIEPPADQLLSVHHRLSEVISANLSGPTLDLRTANFSAHLDGGK